VNAVYQRVYNSIHSTDVYNQGTLLLPPECSHTSHNDNPRELFWKEIISKVLWLPQPPVPSPQILFIVVTSNRGVWKCLSNPNLKPTIRTANMLLLKPLLTTYLCMTGVNFNSITICVCMCTHIHLIDYNLYMKPKNVQWSSQKEYC
jgi:hypothetical protein